MSLFDFWPENSPFLEEKRIEENEEKGLRLVCFILGIILCFGFSQMVLDWQWYERAKAKGLNVKEEMNKPYSWKDLDKFRWSLKSSEGKTFRNGRGGDL
jgi:hypothetical protein